jgi:O-antigen/teichoic acid export membrane protein
MLKQLKQLAGETAIYGLSSILGRLLHFVILTPYLTRVLSPVDYGIYNELYFWTAFILVLLTFRMETTFFRFGTDQEDRPTAFNTGTLLIWGLTLIFSVWFLTQAQTIASWLKYPDHPEFILWIGLIIALDALAAMPFARLRLESRPIRFAVIRLAGISFNILCIFFFLEIRPPYVGMDLTGKEQLSFLFLSNVLASSLVLLLLVPAYLRIRPRMESAWLKKMVNYAFPLVLAALAGITNQLVGTPMLKGFASPDLDYNLEQAGLYGAAAKLAVFMNLFTQAFNYAAEPFFFRQSVDKGAPKLYARVAQAFALFGSFAFLGILLYLDVIQYFLGSEFREALGILPLLLMANLFLGLYYNFSVWFKLKDKTRYGGYIALGGTIIVLSLNFILIPRIGYWGPAWATLACYGFMALAGYWTGRREYPIPYPMWRIIFYLGLSVGIFFLSIWMDGFLPENLWVRLGLHTFWFLFFAALILGLERKTLRKWLPARFS